jgi:parallel beta-helix repeat protein
VGSHDYKVYCLNASTGASIWDYKTGRYVYSSPAVVDGKVFVGSDDGKVYAFSGERVLVVPDDYPTIQEAINGANNGDTVFVRAGTYYEHVVVNKTVSLLGEGVSMTIVDGSGTGNVFAITKDSVTIADFTVQNSGDILGNAGLRLDNVSLCSISGNGIRDNFAGVWFEGSSENLITANNITSNVDDGVVFNYSHNNTISENNIALHEYFGIVINWSHNNTICHNNVTQTHGPSHGDGINLWRSSNNNIFQNRVEENARYGVCIETQSNNNTLSGNVISNCVTGLRVYEFSNYNCIYGNRIANCSSGIELSNADLNKVFQNNITACEYGVKLDHTSNNVIQTNNITGNYVGVAAFYSTATCISDNFIAGNHAGVDNSWYTTRSIISRNYLTANNLSLHIYMSDSNTILKNNITDSGLWGVEMWYSRNNKFFHNNFADNAQHVNIFTPGYANFWDDGYPSGGNCWSDFFAWDIFSGPYQNETGSDGIGDAPYVIDENNVDYYPFVPFRLPADVNNDGYVGIDDIFLIATNFGKEKGQPGWNPLYDIDSDYCVNVTDIFIAARHFGLSSDGSVRL